ncbi:eukaryotic translation initiation factor 3 subunit F-like isoform X1 [Pomacea canaliculata]|uniref:eukaryotic translation initiation factor 3 subunit F-like isoform X1 n=1 Tax=Pomacea canaliculata TaxID=400727 RepID=UPI000D73D8A7|nr:eukaryotic translation initiation factor 3 subunit F-like isoform X1 [Pomacea canaliculata]
MGKTTLGSRISSSFESLMPKTSPTLFSYRKMASNLVCKIHPVVYFSIIDSYERRNEDSKRVIGTLLGVYDKGVVEVTNCFAVPHNESEDEVAVDIDYARSMYELHRKVNSSETIVGWYSTGLEVSVHSVLIHEYYSREARSPIHLTVDTFMRGGKMGMKAYISTTIGVPGKTTGTMFTPVQVETTSYDPEQTGLEVLQQGKFNPKRTVTVKSDLIQIETATSWIRTMLQQVTEYVDNVLSGKVPADNATGRFLLDLVTKVPQIDPEEFEKMLNSNMKDLLMVVYLSNLTRTQLILNEKINSLQS